MRELTDRVAVITGAGSGIGRGAALAFARRGARVVVADLRLERAERVADEIRRSDARALAIGGDVGRDDDVVALAAATTDAFGPADVVMSNVGVLSVGKPEAIPVAEWSQVVNVNLLSTVRMLHAFLPDLLARGEGHVVITASTAGLFAYSYDRMPYAATKGALVSLAESLALYARPRGVGVTCLCPGPVATNIVEQVTVSGEPVPIRAPDLALLDPADVGEMVVEAVLADRFLLLTHPEVQELLVRRAEDPEGFLAGQIARLAEGGEPG